MKPQIPWLRVFVEGVVIVGSILLAFGIDAWWDERQERIEEQEILRGLESDLRANQDALQRAISAHQNGTQRFARLESLASGTAGTESDSVGAYIVSMASQLTFDSRDGTLDAVVASGKLAVLQDVDLRESLIEWKGRVEDISEEGEAVRAAADRVFERMAELGGPWQTEGFGPIVSESAALPTVDLLTLVADERLMGYARLKQLRSGFYLRELIPLAAYTDTVVARVRASLR